MKMLCLFLTVMVILACGLFPASETQPTPTPPTDTPTSVPSTTIPTKVPPTSTNEPSAPDDLFDGRLGISVSNIEFKKSLPSEYDLPDAGDNNIYVSIHLKVTRIMGVHITNLFGYEKEKSTLYDDEGQIHSVVHGTFRGVRFSDPSNITSSYEFVEGAEGVLIFEIPQDRKPDNLQMIYTYQDSMDDNAIKSQGQMTIAFREDGAELLPQSQYDSDWQPIQFTLPSRNNLWTKTSDNSYTATGTSWDTFAWTEETYSGNLMLSFSMDIIYGNANSGGGCIIVFGDGTGWSEGTLIFCINGEYQAIQTDSVYDDTVFLASSDLSLTNKRTYAFTIEILGSNASLYLDGEKIISTALPSQINRSGRIGLYKYSEIPKVTFYKVGFMKID
ncbi:MAG: hypothetical protein Q8L64_03175 [bacterium]|nr:hypothetical protein [bacterium]